MNIERLTEVLSVPTESGREEQMVAFLVAEASKRPGVRFYTDKFNNVIMKKGDAEFYPCVSAHIDSVQPVKRKFSVVRTDGILIAKDEKDQRVGFGADDKAGVYIALELFDRFDTIAAAFFASEEVGCRGSSNVDETLMADMGYVLEFDCPYNDILSYTSGGMRLFEDDAPFIRAALPILNQFGVTKWQRHPYSDVMALRRRFKFSCINLPSGYYNWHMRDECVKLSDTANSLEMATALIKRLGNTRYDFHDTKQPDVPLVKLCQLNYSQP